jgi:hypothetical protein
MTNDDDTTLFVKRYRASVEDVATPTLDQVIMAAAGRQAAKRRFMRRAGGAFLVAAVAIVSIGVGWHAHQSNTNRSIPTVTNYGAIEGLTRPYLLQAGTTQYSGPGLTEGIQ